METKRRRLMNTFAAEDLHSESIQLRALRRPPRAANNLWAPSTKIYRRAAADTMTSTQGSNPATNRLIYSYPSFIHSIHPSIQLILPCMHVFPCMCLNGYIQPYLLTAACRSFRSFVHPSPFIHQTLLRPLHSLIQGIPLSLQYPSIIGFIRLPL